MRTLADAKRKVVILTQKPANPERPTLAELTAETAIEASCRILAGGYNVGPQASETVDEKALCEEGNVQAFGPSNYVAEFSIFRYFDPDTGLPAEGADDTEDGIGDKLYQTLKYKGTRFWLYEREIGLKALDDLEAGHPLEGYEIETDNPTKPEDQGGYIKRNINGNVKRAWLDAEVAGTGS
jgi:hypothetical protein